MKIQKKKSITREIYEGFQRGELERWDAVISPDVNVKSPGLREPVKGIEGLKKWGSEFLKALGPRVDLIDEYEGSGRAFIAVNLTGSTSNHFSIFSQRAEKAHPLNILSSRLKMARLLNFR